MTDPSYLISIDVGVKNIGICVINVANRDAPPILEKSSLLETKAGLRYKQYEEGIADELVYTWLADRWDTYFKYAKLVVLEKQYTTMQSALERGCLVVETYLRAYLRVSFAAGGAPYIALHPTWWKNRAGVEVGNNPIANTPGKYVKGHYTPPNRNASYAVHKMRARNAFYKLFADGDKDVKQIEATRGLNITTDEIEAFLFAKAALANMDELISEARKTQNHDIAMTTNGAKKKLMGKYRQVGLSSFLVPGAMAPTQGPPVVAVEKPRLTQVRRKRKTAADVSTKGVPAVS